MTKSDINSKRQTTNFSCPSCGGAMNFKPASDLLICDYCQSTMDIENTENIIYEYDLDFTNESIGHKWTDSRLFMCENCGAQTVLDENAHAESCPFCNSSHIVEENSNDGILPESVVPFEISKKQSMSLFKSWIKSKFYAPNVLRKNANSGKLHGIYIPYWSYDANVKTNYIASRGVHYYVTKTRTVDGKTETYQERKTRWTRVTGYYDHFFDDHLVHASKNMDEHLITEIRPFNLEKSTKYNPAYLAGFSAERYSISLKDGWHYAVNEFQSTIDSGIESQVGGDECIIKHKESDYSNLKYRHVLLPLWMSSYSYKDKKYTFLVNGQTGEVQGYYPKSIPKILGTIALIGIIIGSIAYYFSVYH